MPAKDTARENAFTAIQEIRPQIARIYREAVQTDVPSTYLEAILDLLATRDFELEHDFAGVVGATRATRHNHDAEAMRKGLRHTHVGFLVPYGDMTHLGAVGGTATAAAAVGLSAAFPEEYATITVLVVPDDFASAQSIAATGIFGEFDVLFGARLAEPGHGFCYTIAGTGERLASLTVRAHSELAVSSIDTLRSTLDEQESIRLSDDGSIVVEAATLAGAREIVENAVATANTSSDADELRYEVVSRTGEMLVSRILARRVKTYGDNLDLHMDKIRKTDPEPPSLWNNISHIVPTYQMAFSVGEAGDDSLAGDERSLSDELFEQIVRAAECLCFTGLDVIRDESFRAIADDQLVKALRERGVERPHRRWLGVHEVLPKPDGEENEPKKRGPRLKDFSIVSGPGLPNPLLRNDN